MKIIQSRSFLGERYGICGRTVTKMLKEIGIHHGHHLTPLDLDIFMKKYGTPEQLKMAQSNLVK